MKILLINNHTRHLESLNKSLSGHEVEVQMYHPGLQFNDKDKDLVILSGGGGEGLEIDDFIQRGKLWYQDEMEFIQRTTKPIIGICMGFEVIARAYGSDIPKMDKMLEGPTQIKTTGQGQRLLGSPKLRQFEAHHWQLTKPPKGFKVLAESQTGIEIIQKDNILATQFHPEKGGTITLTNLIKQTA
jgi:GMP synthase-like glutamine amidotransferase